MQVQREALIKEYNRLNQKFLYTRYLEQLKELQQKLARKFNRIQRRQLEAIKKPYISGMFPSRQKWHIDESTNRMKRDAVVDVAVYKISFTNLPQTREQMLQFIKGRAESLIQIIKSAHPFEEIEEQELPWITPIDIESRLQRYQDFWDKELLKSSAGTLTSLYQLSRRYILKEFKSSLEEFSQKLEDWSSAVEEKLPEYENHAFAGTYRKEQPITRMRLYDDDADNDLKSDSIIPSPTIGQITNYLSYLMGPYGPMLRTAITVYETIHDVAHGRSSLAEGALTLGLNLAGEAVGKIASKAGAVLGEKTKALIGGSIGEIAGYTVNSITRASIEGAYNLVREAAANFDEISAAVGKLKDPGASEEEKQKAREFLSEYSLDKIASRIGKTVGRSALQSVVESSINTALGGSWGIDKEKNGMSQWHFKDLVGEEEFWDKDIEAMGSLAGQLTGITYDALVYNSVTLNIVSLGEAVEIVNRIGRKLGSGSQNLSPETSERGYISLTIDWSNKGQKTSGNSTSEESGTKVTINLFSDAGYRVNWSSLVRYYQDVKRGASVIRFIAYQYLKNRGYAEQVMTQVNQGYWRSVENNDPALAGMYASIVYRSHEIKVLVRDIEDKVGYSDQEGEGKGVIYLNETLFYGIKDNRALLIGSVVMAHELAHLYEDEEMGQLAREAIAGLLELRAYQIMRDSLEGVQLNGELEKYRENIKMLEGSLDEGGFVGYLYALATSRSMDGQSIDLNYLAELYGGEYGIKVSGKGSKEDFFRELYKQKEKVGRMLDEIFAGEWGSILPEGKKWGDLDWPEFRSVVETINGEILNIPSLRYLSKKELEEGKEVELSREEYKEFLKKQFSIYLSKEGNWRGGYVRAQVEEAIGIREHDYIPKLTGSDKVLGMVSLGVLGYFLWEAYGLSAAPEYVDLILKSLLGSRRSVVYYAAKEALPKVVNTVNAVKAYFYGKETGDWGGALWRGVVLPYLTDFVVGAAFPRVFTRLGLNWVYGFRRTAWGGWIPYGFGNRFLSYKDFVNWHLICRGVSWGVGYGLNNKYFSRVVIDSLNYLIMELRKNE